MSSNNPPNGHSHIDNKLANALRFREGQLRDALKQIQQLNLGIQSISTLAALYKVQLQETVEYLLSEGITSDAKIVVEKARKLLAAGHMEPVNEILRLRAELEKANALTGSQANMIEQLEKEVKSLTIVLETTRLQLSQARRNAS